MTSGAWITLYVPFFLVSFVAWELIQLARRRAGNESARTLSQYVIYRAEQGSKVFKILIVAFPLFLLLVSAWLFFHFEGLCINWRILCDLNI